MCGNLDVLEKCYMADLNLVLKSSNEADITLVLNKDKMLLF